MSAKDFSALDALLKGDPPAGKPEPTDLSALDALLKGDLTALPAATAAAPPSPTSWDIPGPIADALSPDTFSPTASTASPSPAPQFDASARKFLAASSADYSYSMSGADLDADQRTTSQQLASGNDIELDLSPALYPKMDRSLELHLQQVAKENPETARKVAQRAFPLPGEAPDLTPQEYKSHGKVGLLESYGQAMASGNWKYKIPFVGGFMESGDLGNIYARAKRLNTGHYGKGHLDQALRNQDIAVLRNWGEAEEQLAARGKNIWAHVGDTVASSVPFMIEFGMTLGTAPGARKAGKLVFRRAFQGEMRHALRLARKWGKSASRVAARRVVTTGANRTMAGLMERLIDKGIYVDEQGNYQARQPGQSALGATMNTLVSEYIEGLSEQTGEVVVGPVLELAGKAAGKLAPVAAKKLAQTLWAKTAKAGLKLGISKAKLARLIKTGGYDGVIEEMGEESVGEILRATVSSLVPGIDVGTWQDAIPTLEKQGIQLIAFSIPGTVAGISRAAARTADMGEQIQSAGAAALSEATKETTPPSQEAPPAETTEDPNRDLDPDELDQINDLLSVHKPDADGRPTIPAGVGRATVLDVSPQGVTLDQAGRQSTMTPEQLRQRLAQETEGEDGQIPLQRRAAPFVVDTVRDPDKKAKGRWAVVERASLAEKRHAGEEAGLQARDRSRQASREQGAERKAKFQPHYLGDSNVADRGSVIVTRDGRILAGYGRLGTLGEVYDENTDQAKAYRTWVAKEAEAKGLKHQLRGIKEPVLVRVAEEFVHTDETEFATYSNDRVTLGFSPAEQAMKDARMVRDQSLDQLLEVPDSGDLEAASNRDFAKAFIHHGRVGAEMLGRDGEPLPELGERMQRAVLAALFVDDAEGPATVNFLLEQNRDAKTRRLAQTMVTVAPRLLKLARTNPAFDILQPLAPALKEAIRARNAVRAGQAPSEAEFFRQSDFLSDASDEQREIASLLLEESPDTVREVLRRYATAAETIDPNTDSLFATEELPDETLLGILKGVWNNVRQEQGRPPAAQARPSQQEQSQPPPPNPPASQGPAAPAPAPAPSPSVGTRQAVSPPANPASVPLPSPQAFTLGEPFTPAAREMDRVASFGAGIEGPNGNRLLAYQHIRREGERENAEGDIIGALVSDQDRAVPCADCGRPLVHAWYVGTPDGTVRAYGREHLHDALGRSRPIDDRQAKQWLSEADETRRNKEERDRSRAARILPAQGAEEGVSRKGLANQNYQNSNRPMSLSYFAENKAGDLVRVDGTDQEDVEWYAARGFVRASEPVAFNPDERTRVGRRRWADGQPPESHVPPAPSVPARQAVPPPRPPTLADAASIPVEGTVETDEDLSRLIADAALELASRGIPEAANQTPQERTQQALATQIAAAGRNANPTRIVAAASEIPDAAFGDKGRPEREDQVESMLGADGTVYLVASTLRAQADSRGLPLAEYARRKWVHEQAGHHRFWASLDADGRAAALDGIAAALGDKALRAALPAFYSQEADRRAEAYGPRAGQHYLAAEYLARLTERIGTGATLSQAETTTWTRFREAVRQLLRKLGIRTKAWTNAEIDALATRLVGSLRQPSSSPTASTESTSQKFATTLPPVYSGLTLPQLANIKATGDEADHTANAKLPTEVHYSYGGQLDLPGFDQAPQALPDRRGGAVPRQHTAKLAGLWHVFRRARALPALLPIARWATPTSDGTLNSPALAAGFASALQNPLQERLLLIPLDAKGRISPAGAVLLSLGGIDRAQVNSEVVWQAMAQSGGSTFVLAHNHPSGNLTPSAADMAVTRSVIEGCAALGMPGALVDHLIVGANGFTSLREEGLSTFGTGDKHPDMGLAPKRRRTAGTATVNMTAGFGIEEPGIDPTSQQEGPLPHIHDEGNAATIARDVYSQFGNPAGQTLWLGTDGHNTVVAMGLLPERADVAGALHDLALVPGAKRLILAHQQRGGLQLNTNTDKTKEAANKAGMQVLDAIELGDDGSYTSLKAGGLFSMAEAPKPLRDVTIPRDENAETPLARFPRSQQQARAQAIAEVATWPRSLTAADGSEIRTLVPDRGSMVDRVLHLGGSRDSGQFDQNKMQWLPRVPETLETASVRVADLENGDNQVYLKHYPEGLHAVVVTPYGAVLAQEPIKGFVQTQFPRRTPGRLQDLPVTWQRSEKGARHLPGGPTPLPSSSASQDSGQRADAQDNTSPRPGRQTTDPRYSLAPDGSEPADAAAVWRMPALVELSRLLLAGKLPGIARAFRKPGVRGQFHPVGTGSIALLADIFTGPSLGNYEVREEEGQDREQQISEQLKETVPGLTDENLVIKRAPSKRKGWVVLKAFRRDHDYANKTLAHEIGHAYDWSDDKTLTRGNILGHVAALHTWLKGMIQAKPPADPDALMTKEQRAELNKEASRRASAIAGSRAKNKDGWNKARREAYAQLQQDWAAANGIVPLSVVSAELKDLTQWWRPFNPDADPTYTSYRHSAEELTADAISVLLNAPEELATRAPAWYDLFQNHMRSRPIAAKAYQQTMETLFAGGTMSALVQRTHAGFREGHRRWQLRYLQDHSIPGGLGGWLKRQISSRAASIATAERQADNDSPTRPTRAIEEARYAAALQERYARSVFTGVLSILHESRLAPELFGEYLLHNRILGDRYDLANPGGWRPASSRQRLQDMREELGDARFDALGRAAEQFRTIREQQVLAEMSRLGVWSDELLDRMRQNDRYARFDVVKYIDEHYGKGAGLRIFGQLGTLDDIASPLEATMAQDMRFLSEAKWNWAKRTLAQAMLAGDLPGQILPAETAWTGTHLGFTEPKEQGLDLITFLDKGQQRGYYIPSEFAIPFARSAAGDASIARSLAGKIGHLQRLVLVMAKPGYHAYNMVRDAARTAINAPGAASPLLMPAYYAKAGWELLREGFAGQSDVLDNMLAHGELISMADRRAARQLDTELARILVSYGMKNPATKSHNPALGLAASTWSLVRSVPRFIERLSKVAGHIYLTERYPELGEAEIAHRVRTQLGSPDFLERGSWTWATNQLFLFSNAMVQGMKSDWEAATGETALTAKAAKGLVTRGTLYKRLLVYGGPAVLLWAAKRGLLAGLFGGDDDDKDNEWAKAAKEFQESMQSVAEHDATNYLCLPLSRYPNGQTMYFRIPLEESGRVAWGMIWHTLDATLGDGANKTLAIGQALNYGADQIPSKAPILEVLQGAVHYLTGRIPVDSWRNRPIMPQTTYDAAEKRPGPARAAFGKWAWSKLGLGLLWNFQPDWKQDQPRAPEGTIAARVQKIDETPSAAILNDIVGRFIKVTDYGREESLRRDLHDLKIDAAVAAEVKREQARALANGTFDLALIPENEQRIFLQNQGDILTAANKLARAKGLPALDRVWLESTKLQRLELERKLAAKAQK